MRSVPPAVGGWRVDQVGLLQMGADIVGVQDTCRLAIFVAVKKCRRVAEFLAGPGLSLLCASPVEQPLQDPGLEAVGSYEATARSGAAGLDEDNGGSETASQCSPALKCSLGSSRASRQSGTTSSQDDPCAPDKVHDFAPCFHSGECTEERCRCARTGLACEKTCGCAQYLWTVGSPSLAGLGSIGESIEAPGSRLCGRRIWGACVPLSSCDTDECPCFAVDRECDPDACDTCGAHWHPSTGVDGVPHSPDEGVQRACAQELRGAGLLIAADVESGGVAAGGVVGRRRCRNVQLQVGARVRCVLGRSDAHGFGVFAAEGAAEGDFVGEYVGELISNAEAAARGRVYDAKGVSFLYSITKTVRIDATLAGNRMKFMNHRTTEHANVEAKLLSVCGEIRVGLSAKAPLCAGEELFSDYGYELPGWVE